MPRSPRRLLTAMLLLVAASTAFLGYWEYSRQFYAEPHIWSQTLAGGSEAPMQYRLGVLWAARFISSHGHMGMRHALALIDLLALLLSFATLRSLLTRSASWVSATLAQQWLGAAGLVVLVEYFLWWLLWYERPETLTIAALLLVSLWLTTYRVRIAGGIAWNAAGLLVAAFLLGTVRADVGFTFNLGIAAACVLRLGGGEAACRRWTQAAVSLAAAGTSAAVQLYMMRVLYPHATYGNTPMVQLLLNAKDPMRWPPFLLFVAPAAWLVVQLARRRLSATRPQLGLLFAAALFTVMWVVVGKMDEVRIFLPFAFALTPLTVEALLATAHGAEGVLPAAT